MRFEVQKDRDREAAAIKFWGAGHVEYMKLGKWDTDFKITSHTSSKVGYAEVKGRNRNIDDAFPLPIAARKLVKLDDKRKQDSEATVAFVIWACLDGIVWCDLDTLRGVIRMGGRAPRKGSTNDIEVMAYYSANSSPFKTRKF